MTTYLYHNLHIRSLLISKFYAKNNYAITSIRFMKLGFKQKKKVMYYNVAYLLAILVAGRHVSSSTSTFFSKNKHVRKLSWIWAAYGATELYFQLERIVNIYLLNFASKRDIGDNFSISIKDKNSYMIISKNILILSELDAVMTCDYVRVKRIMRGFVFSLLFHLNTPYAMVELAFLLRLYGIPVISD